MQHSPSWEANRFSASQEIPRILCNRKVHYRTHKCPPPVPVLSHINPNYALHPNSWRSVLLSSHLHLGLPSGFFPSGFPTKTLYALLLSPCMLYAPLVSFFSIWSVFVKRYEKNPLPRGWLEHRKYNVTSNLHQITLRCLEQRMMFSVLPVVQ